MTILNDESVPAFQRLFFNSNHSFTRMGYGQLGGKATGLLFVKQHILSKLNSNEFSNFEISVPSLVVLTTELFDLFMERNKLYTLALSDEPDDRIAFEFQKAVLPAEYVGDLQAVVKEVHTPLAIRSSSLLEDSLEHPFAGVYATKMIPNNQPSVDTRFLKLIEAIKFVFASTFSKHAKNYIHSVGQEIEAEKMAVIIQEVIGQRYQERFYPCISGVARSYNYYATGLAKPQDGVVNLALGLGKTIVDGGISWTYCPACPRSPPPFNSVQSLIRQTQTKFWAVYMGRPLFFDPLRETEYLVEKELLDAETDDVLDLIVSTYDPDSDRIYPGLGEHGPRVVNFAPILAGHKLALNDLLRHLLELSKKETGKDVEIEFAINLNHCQSTKARLGFLQVRPMMVCDEQVEIRKEDMCKHGIVLATNNVLGNGSRNNISDIVFLKPETFDSKHTRKIASELSKINQSLVNTNRPYMLIGFGRWGSQDPWLGVPVKWSQICGAKVIVEATLPQMNPELSQGSHFFHNLISSYVLYLSVPQGGKYKIDWNWLNKQETISETKYIKHIWTACALTILADGTHGRGIVKYHERN